MNKSDYVAGFLNINTQRAYAERVRAADEPAPKEKEKQPDSANVALLRRVQRIVFSENVKTLDEAKSRFASLLDALVDSDEESKKAK